MNIQATLAAACVVLLADVNALFAAPVPRPKVRVTVISAHGSSRESLQVLNAGRLSGSYDLADGMGYRVNLVLKLRGQFDCVWYGCFGEAGTARGAWNIDENGLKLVAEQGEGLLEELPLDLDVVSFQQHYLLAPRHDWPWFDFKPPTFRYFHRAASRRLVEQEERRRAKAAQ